MTAPLLLFLAAAVVPVFFSRIRVAWFWLTVQAAALTWAAALQHHTPSAHALVAMAELLLLRVLLAPQLLRRAVRLRGESNRELLPSNLFAWAVAIALIVLAFQFGAPELGNAQALTLGTVAATVVVALVLLAANNTPPAQLVALLFMENALALFELTQAQPWPLPVHLALSAVYLLTVAVGAWLIAHPEEGPVDEADVEGAQA